MSTLDVAGTSYEIAKLEDVDRLPYSLRVLLENALRHGDEEGADAVATWDPAAEPSRELEFRPARVLLQDFTGVPAIVDLAAMRDAIVDLGGDPSKVDPQLPSELVIDHSIQVDTFATRLAIEQNVERDYERNRERYAFLRWGQHAFASLRVVPPNTGIVHQVNLEYLARVIESRDGQAFPDTLVGTDSHTTMVNGLGVLGWGAGGIEAEAAMLGEPVSMLVPQVVGFRLTGGMPEGATATDLVLTVTELLRKTGVVGKFVEYFGPGLEALTVADRATIANMAPEYGATCGFFPVDGADPRLPAPDRPAAGTARARRGVLQGERALARERHAPGVLAGRRPRPRRRRAEPGGAAAAAGPRPLARGEGVVPRGAAVVQRRAPGGDAGRGDRRDVSGERPDRRPVPRPRPGSERKSSWRPPSRTARSAPSS